MICLAIGRYQPGIFYLQKLWISKKKTHTFYKRKINTSLNLTQFHIPNHNTNLKMNLYENSIFYVLSWPLEKQKDFEQFFLGLDYSCKYTHNKMSNQETEDVLYWRLGILNCTWCHDIKRWERNQLGMVESTFELQLLTTSWALRILNCNTEVN